MIKNAIETFSMFFLPAVEKAAGKYLTSAAVITEVKQQNPCRMVKKY
jgi:hypothetical protein